MQLHLPTAAGAAPQIDERLANAISVAPRNDKRLPTKERSHAATPVRTPALLAVLGGVVGAGLTYMIFDGFTAWTVGANSRQVVVAFDVSREL